MRIFFGVLSALVFWFASRRFARSEEVGYDIGALFLLLIGIRIPPSYLRLLVVDTNSFVDYKQH